MTEKYEFPEELRLITDEPVEDDGWGEFPLDSESSKAGMVINGMVVFVVNHRCLLAPTLDLDKHIATLVMKRFCPFGKVVNLDDQHKIREQFIVASAKERHKTEEQIRLQLSEFIQRLETMDRSEPRTCPCDEAASELQRDGYSSCGIFVTEQYLKEGQYATLFDCTFPICKEKTQALWKIYKGIESGIPAILAYHGFQKKHLDILSQRAKTSSYWAKMRKFLLIDIAMHRRLTTGGVKRLEKIKRRLGEVSPDKGYRHQRERA